MVRCYFAAVVFALSALSAAPVQEKVALSPHFFIVTEVDKDGLVIKRVDRIDDETLSTVEYKPAFKEIDATDPKGKKLTADEVVKRVKPGSVVLVSADEKPVDPVFLAIVKDDTVILAGVVKRVEFKDNDTAAALRALHGKWVVTSSKEFGRPGELHVGDEITVDSEGLTHDGPGSGKPLTYKIRISPKAEPNRIDWRPAEPKEAAWSHRGIYKFDGEKLIVCMIARFDADDEKDRPSEFKSKAGREKGDAAGSVLLVLERKKSP
ncbi:MAG: TIGR03067 domain-containing protein [Planctomycetaceae bacterium]